MNSTDPREPRLLDQIRDAIRVKHYRVSVPRCPCRTCISGRLCRTHGAGADCSLWSGSAGVKELA
jgi:hypothetical protein